MFSPSQPTRCRQPTRRAVAKAGGNANNNDAFYKLGPDSQPMDGDAARYLFVGPTAHSH